MTVLVRVSRAIRSTRGTFTGHNEQHAKPTSVAVHTVHDAWLQCGSKSCRVLPPKHAAQRLKPGVDHCGFFGMGRQLPLLVYRQSGSRRPIQQGINTMMHGARLRPPP